MAVGAGSPRRSAAGARSAMSSVSGSLSSTSVLRNSIASQMPIVRRFLARYSRFLAQDEVERLVAVVEPVELADGRADVVAVVAERRLLPRLADSDPGGTSSHSSRLASGPDSGPRGVCSDMMRLPFRRPTEPSSARSAPWPAERRLSTVPSLRNGSPGPEAAWGSALRRLSHGSGNLSRPGHLVEDRRPALESWNVP